MKKTYIKFGGFRLNCLVLPKLFIWLIFGIFFIPAQAQQCLPISSFTCPNVKVSTPVNFTFNGSDGGLTDKNGIGTGFRMADNPSAPLVTPSNTAIPGYEPSLLHISSGKLNITTTAGLAFRDPSQSARTNSQVNALGVGVNADQKLIIQTTLVQPSAGTGKFEQAGLWFGLDEDNYVKFDIVSAGSGRSQIEMVKEVGAISLAGDSKKTTAMTLSSSIVVLKLILNNTTKTLEGRYAVNGGAEVVLGSVSIPDTFISGKPIGGSTISSFAGIYTSHRTATTPITFSFEDFKVEAETSPTNPTEPIEPTEPTEFTVINWSTVAPQKYTVNEAQGKVVKDKLYTFGGFDSQKSIFVPTKRSFVYDPVANAWTAIADLPHLPNGADFGGITHAGITTDGTDIYLAGGYTSNSSGTGQIFGTKQVWKYNVTQNNYTRLPDLPIDISGGQLEFLNGKLHHIGGTNLARTMDLGNHYVLDLSNLAGGWKTLALLPSPRHHAGSSVYDNKIYFIGGQHGHDGSLITTKVVHAYNPTNNTWAQMADLPVPSGANGRGHISSSVVQIGKRILVLGGETVHHSGRTNMVSAYSAATNTWENLTPLPQNRFSGVAGVMNGNIFYTGGSGTSTTYKGVPNGTVSTIKVLTFAPTTLNFSVQQGGTTPSQTSNLSANEGAPTITLTKSSNSNWLVLPASPTLGNLSYSINASGLNPGNYQATVTGAATGYTSATLQVNLTVTSSPTLSFTPATLNFSVVQGGTSPNQASVLSASEGSPAIILTKSANSNWLVLPASPALGNLSFGINASGLAPGNYQSIVTASSTGYTPTTLQVNLVVSQPTTNQSILFSQASQNIEVIQGKSQTLLEYIATSDNKVVSASLNAADESMQVPNWLTVNGKILNGISYTTGSEISFVINASTLAVGTYSAVVTASATGYTNGLLEIKITVKSESGGTLTHAKVNFQNEATIPPTGWLRDFGQPFGSRTSTYQGSGHTYGWKKRSDNLPVDLTAFGRKRNSPSDVLLSTLMHMQVVENSVPIEGIWEMKVTNGNYDVSVSVGDGSFTDSEHYINVEGVNAIVNFVPTSSELFRSATVTVSVADGYLTIDPIGGTNTKINSITIQPSSANKPSVVNVNPEDGSINISENTSISTSALKLPNGGINNTTITNTTVYLAEESTGLIIPSNVNGTGGGDAITLVPGTTLKFNTTYRFTITDGVKDLSGVSFIPYSSAFTTGSGTAGDIINAQFDKIELANTKGRHSSLTMGPDNKLYATTIDGIIKRFTVNSDGTLGNPEMIYSLQDAYGSRQQRLLIGFAFDPSATATNLVAWVSHSSFVFLNGPDWDGKLTKLSGNNLQTVQDVIINLPRSTKDHLTNSIAFGPDKALYFTQGSITAMGKEDNTWGLRPERLLSAAVLRLDQTKLGTLPLNAKTAEGGGNYNPYATNAPLTIYASGTRNAYDLVWHSNGKLYVPTNGSAAGGNTPASVNGTLRPDGTTYNGPAIPSLTNVKQTQKDFLFRVEKGGYYGHPNPLRGEYVMNGGNPTSAIDPAQVDDYPVGIAPDTNWRGYSFDFENNKSPNGIIEYKSDAFNGVLKGKLLVVRYSQNDDIICLTPGGANLDIVSSIEGSSIPGFSGFIDPLDLTEDVKTGNIYVSEYGGEGKITLLKPKSTTTPPNPTLITLHPVADSYVRNGSFAGSNYGTDNNILIKGANSSGFSRRSYLKFTLQEISSIGSAKLRIYGGNTEDASYINIVAYGVNDDSWTETGINWNNAPTSITAQLNSVEINDVKKYYEIDVTNFVKSQLSGDKVVSLMLSNPSIQVKTITLNSRENSLFKPELIIETTATEPNNGLIAVSPLKIYDNDVSGGDPGLNRSITIKNNGAGNLTVTEISLSGTNLNQFLLNNLPAFPQTISAGGSYTFNVAFHPTSTGLKTASVIIKNSDSKSPSISVPLRGLGTAGLGGTNEPSLQAILNLLEIPVTVGDDDAATNVIHSSTTSQKAALLGEEVSIQKFIKAGTGNVTIEPLAVFGPTETNPVLGMGWYLSGDINSKKELFTVSNSPASNGQTVNVNISGVTTFDPAAASFGFYSRWPFFNNRHVYSEDQLNSFTGSIPHHVRVYPFKNSSGIVPNAYIIAFEEHTSGFDYQDLLFVVKNVKPAATTTVPTDPNVGIVVENLDNFPSHDDLVFSTIQIPWSRDGVVYNANHDEVSVRIFNKGTSNLTISGLNISNTAYWEITKLSGATYTGSSLPLSIGAGKFADVTFKFIAKDLNTRVRILRETLTIVSNDASTPNKVVRLNGLWQYRGEGNNEPYAQEIIDVFGFKTKTGFGRNDPDKGNPAKLKGDEILSFYYTRADNSKPIYIRQLAAYHGCCNATERIMWHAKGSTTLNTVFTHIALDGQSLLPRRSTTNNAPAEGNFSPTGAFGFKVGGKDWTDATKTPDNLIGIRVWKAIDRNGKVIKDTYIIANDYLGSDFTNYDYNDNVYYVTNIKPEEEPYALKTTPSAVDFGEKLTGSTTNLSFNLSNLGVVYADGSKDPTIQISSIEIVGDHKAEFTSSLPAKTTLNPQESTNISVAFKPTSQGFKIADLLVHHNGLQSPHRVPLYGIAKGENVTVSVHHRINSGSSTAVTIGGKTWAADNMYAFDNLEPYQNKFLSQISATDEDAIYLTEQSSSGDKLSFRYEIPVSNGNYVVRLHFAEIYWGSLGSGSSGGVGSRVMSVNIEGQTLLSSYDVVKEVGKASAVIKNFPVSVTDGKLNINFAASVNRPMVCAIEVYSFSSSTTSSTISMAMAKESSISSELEFESLKVYPNPLNDRFTMDFPESYEGKTTISLIDQYGKIMELGQPILEKGGSKMEIDISSLYLRSGIYYLRLHSDNRKTENIKLIIR